MTPTLVERVHAMGPEALRLLKLFSPGCFDAANYYHRHRIAAGAYGTVYAAHPAHSSKEVIVKLIDLPRKIHDRCVLRELFNELTILERIGEESELVCQLYDYGVDREYAYMVMHSYQCSLKQWREGQTGDLSRNVLLYMWIFHRVVEAVHALHRDSVVHFDIKCDNILLEQKGGAEDPFTVAVADFGESKSFNGLSDEATFRSHGTEFIMSPEAWTCTPTVVPTLILTLTPTMTLTRMG